jgi:hypothetical protein
MCSLHLPLVQWPCVPQLIKVCVSRLLALSCRTFCLVFEQGFFSFVGAFPLFLVFLHGTGFIVYFQAPG